MQQHALWCRGWIAKAIGCWRHSVAPSSPRHRPLSHPAAALLTLPPLQAEAGAPDVLAALSNACAKIGGNDASKLAPVACLALELLFTLERCHVSLSFTS